MAIVLALLAAAANALATVLQRIGVEEVSTESRSSSSLIAGLLRRPIWFAGLGLTIASFLLQAIALSLGDLSSVQPVMVTELLFLAIILGGWFKLTFGTREWAGIAGTVAGLGTFLALSSARGGHQRPDRLNWTLLLIACCGAILLAAILGARGTRSWRAAWLGTGGAVAFALTAAFIKTAADVWSHGPVGLLLHWQTYGIAVAGLGGFVMTQHALQAGPVAASQSALLIVNPLSSIVMGIWLFGDRLRTAGGRGPVEVAALAAMFASLYLLSHSPLIADDTDEARLSEGRAQMQAEGISR
ncbi:MAG TPA: DMT family transporter [Acidimicrobiales bacterium]|nr:DMT family transporter [Acidimicrobiales bacterium]